MSQTKCRFSIHTLKDMQKNHIPFKTGGGESIAWIHEVNEEKRTVYIERSTHKVSWALDLDKLEDVHNRIHSGELILDQYVIDEVAPTFGTYIAGFLKHCGCHKD